MSKQYDNTNSGALFKNKEKTPEHPKWADYNGSLNVDGRDYWLSAWVKETKTGEKIMSLAVKRKDGAAPPHRAQQQRQPLNDDMPF